MSIIPGIDQTPVHFLEQVNNELMAVTVMATADFKLVKSMLREYFDKESAWKQVHDPAIDRRIDALISDLQYMDIFCQRVEHLVWVHQRVIVERSAAPFRESIFHLHIFQSMTIERDLSRTVASIHGALAELREHLTKASGTTWTPETFFRNTARIQKVLTRTIAALTTAAGDIQRLPVPPFSERLLQMLYALYTMESERLVLDWFVKTIPVCHWDDLCQHYETTLHQPGAGDDMELF